MFTIKSLAFRAVCELICAFEPSSALSAQSKSPESLCAWCSSWLKILLESARQYGIRSHKQIWLGALSLLLLSGTSVATAAPGGEAPSPDFRYPSLFPPAPTVGPAAPRIQVDLSQQELVAFEGATPIRAFATSTGDWQHPTLVGTFAVQWKREKIDLIGPDWYYHDVPYVMMFATPFYIHSAPWRPEFGARTSHGCVTLAVDDAAWLFHWAEVGTPIVITW
jgi:hypothetical protein